MSPLTQLDFQILDWIAAHLRCDLLNLVMPGITHLVDYGALWIALAVILLISPKTRRLGVCLAAALAIEFLCCSAVLKPLVARVRPYDLKEGVQLLVKAETDRSFPSGHTAASFAAAGVLFRKRSRLRFPALIIALLVAFSRLYLYLHYPSDVLSAIPIGLACGFLGVWAGEKLYNSIQNHGKLKS